MKVVATNKKARFDFEIFDKYEAGIELKGSEVKALRAGRANLKDSYVKIKNGEAFLMQAHISHLDTTNPHYKHDELRPRKLLLHKEEINRLEKAIKEKGYTVVPLRLYFNNKNLAKLEIALARGKKLHDKRETLKRKTQELEAKQAMKRYFR